MARQIGPLKVRGTIDDLNFYKSSDGKLLREKGGVTAERIKTDPAFELTRQNMSEFGYAGNAGKLIRYALNTLVSRAGDEKLISRLVKKIRGLMQTDTVSLRGERKLTKQNVTALANFEFNDGAPFEFVFKKPVTTTVDRAKGTVSLAIASFIAKNNIEAPTGSTHFKLVAAAAFIDFANNKRSTVYTESDLFEINYQEVTPDPLGIAVATNTDLPLFVAIGIEFSQKSGGNMYQMKSADVSAAKILVVDVQE